MKKESIKDEDMNSDNPIDPLDMIISNQSIGLSTPPEVITNTFDTI